MVAPVRLYNASGAGVGTTAGIGDLTQALSCVVKEERNGSFELEMKYPSTGILAGSFEPRQIIYCKPSPGRNAQRFRIYSVGDEERGIIKIKAAHISYDLSGWSRLQTVAKTFAWADTPGYDACRLSFLSLVRCETGEGTGEVIGQVLQDTTGQPFPFTYTYHRSDPPSGYSFQFKKGFSNMREILGGSSDSILSAWGGELLFDNYAIHYYDMRGSNKGATLQYRKNIKDFTSEKNSEHQFSALIPYLKLTQNNVEYIYTLEDTYYKLESTIDYSRVLPIDINSLPILPSGVTFNAWPGDTGVKNLLARYVTETKIGSIATNITVKYADLGAKGSIFESETGMEGIELGDYVTVIHPNLDTAITKEVIETEYDVLKNAYVSIELGERSNTSGGTSSLSSLLVGISSSFNDTHIINQAEIDHLKNDLNNMAGQVQAVDDKADTAMTNAEAAQTAAALAEAIADNASDVAAATAAVAQALGVEVDDVKVDIETQKDVTKTIIDTQDAQGVQIAAHEETIGTISDEVDGISGTVEAHTERITTLVAKDGEIEASVAQETQARVQMGNNITTLVEQKEAAIKVTTDNITATVSNNKAITDGQYTRLDSRCSNIEQDADGIKTSVRNVQTLIDDNDTVYKERFTAIEEDADSIKSTVAEHTGDITGHTESINTITQTLDGVVYEDTETGVTVIDGSHITTGQIDANKVSMYGIQLKPQVGDNMPPMRFDGWDEVTHLRIYNPNTLGFDPADMGVKDIVFDRLYASRDGYSYSSLRQWMNSIESYVYRESSKYKLSVVTTNCVSDVEEVVFQGTSTITITISSYGRAYNVVMDGPGTYTKSGNTITVRPAATGDIYVYVTGVHDRYYYVVKPEVWHEGFFNFANVTEFTENIHMEIGDFYLYVTENGTERECGTFQVVNGSVQFSKRVIARYANGSGGQSAIELSTGLGSSQDITAPAKKIAFNQYYSLNPSPEEMGSDFYSTMFSTFIMNNYNYYGTSP